MVRFDRSTQIVFLTSLLVFSCFFVRSELRADTVARPNIIFILADDQGWNGTSVQMHPDLANSKSDFYKTPNLEKLAASGLRFSHAYSPGPMCSPTRASILTGKSPAQLRMTNVGRGRPANASQPFVVPPHSSSLSTDEVSIGEKLQSAGYATAWFGKWHLGGEHGPGAHGFDEHDGPTGNADGNTNDPKNPKDIFGITHRGLAFMEKNVNAKKPFYLQLCHYAVHGPVQSLKENEAAYAKSPAGKIHRSPAFAGMTENLDSGVGMIMKKIKDLGIEDNTYLVYMSDHGSGVNLSSNAPLNRGKGTLWEGGLRVPLIIRGPGVKAGEFCSVPTVGWDLFPTFCELASIESAMPIGLEGISLKPVFATGEYIGSDEKQPRDELAFHFPHYAQSKPHSTITIGDYKLIKYYEKNQLFLFNLTNDIGEQNNLAEPMPDKTDLMHNRLMAYLKKVDAGIPTSNPNYDPTAIAESGGGRGGTGGRAGRREAGGRSPQAARIEGLQKEMETLDKVVKKKDFKKIGELITAMKKAAENRPQRSRSPAAGRGANANRPNPREQRARELQQLDKANQRKDLEKLGQLIDEINARLKTHRVVR